MPTACEFQNLSGSFSTGFPLWLKFIMVTDHHTKMDKDAFYKQNSDSNFGFAIAYDREFQHVVLSCYMYRQVKESKP